MQSVSMRQHKQHNNNRMKISIVDLNVNMTLYDFSVGSSNNKSGATKKKNTHIDGMKHLKKTQKTTFKKKIAFLLQKNNRNWEKHY